MRLVRHHQQHGHSLGMYPSGLPAPTSPNRWRWNYRRSPDSQWVHSSNRRLPILIAVAHNAYGHRRNATDGFQSDKWPNECCFCNVDNSIFPDAAFDLQCLGKSRVKIPIYALEKQTEFVCDCCLFHDACGCSQQPIIQNYVQLISHPGGDHRRPVALHPECDTSDGQHARNQYFVRPGQSK